MQVEERVKELVEEKIAVREDLFIVEIKMQKNGLLSILLDGDNGVAIEDCVQVSRHVGFHLEEENAIETAYRLEVSSPGVGSALQTPRQYSKNIGRNVEIILSDNGQRKEGELIEVTNDAIVLGEKVKEKGKKAILVQTEIPLSQIKETKVLISFK